MRHLTREQLLDANYRKIEAMFRRGTSIDDICRSTGLSKIDVLDVTQKIFALDMARAWRLGAVATQSLFFLPSLAKFTCSFMNT